MTAKLTIMFSDDVLKALKASKAITVALQSGARAPRGGSSGPRGGGARSGAGGFREGSLPAKLMGWAGSLKKPFGVPDIMKKFKIKRGHASMLVAYVVKAGAVDRVGRGQYTPA
jgi:hypothetical protein